MAACGYKGCDKHASWQVGFSLQASYSDVTAHAIIGLVVCDQHKQDTKLEDVLSDEGWEVICKSFAAQGKAIPERRKTKLEWKALS
jgi:hypothetical protein